MGQVTLADNNGHLSACFCVMRRERRRLLDLRMRVTVYNPLTASSYWRMAAGLTELRHACCNWTSRGTEESCGGHTALSVAPIQRCVGSFMGTSTWCLRVKQKCWCVVALLVSLVQTRIFATGMLPATPVERTMRCRGGKKKKRPRTFLFHCSLLASLAIAGRGEATPWRKTLDADVQMDHVSSNTLHADINAGFK